MFQNRFSTKKSDSFRASLRKNPRREKSRRFLRRSSLSVGLASPTAGTVSILGKGYGKGSFGGGAFAEQMRQNR